MNKFLFLLLIAIPIVFDSCSVVRLFRGKRSSNRITSITDTIGSKVPQAHHFTPLPLPDTVYAERSKADTTAKPKVVLEQVKPLWQNKLAFSTLTSKVKVHYESPEDQQDFTANIRVKTDSAIWIDIWAFGGIIHAARGLITTDSIYVINYINREYMLLGIAEEVKLLPVPLNYKNLQNLIAGNPLSDGEIVDATELAESWILKVADSNYNHTLQYSKAQGNPLLTNQVQSKKSPGPEALIKMDEYQFIGGKSISASREINVQNGVAKYYIQLYLQNIDLDKPTELPFSIPKNYKQKK